MLLSYSAPMFLSVLFQQMYTLADSVIAGKFAGQAALAAVGASNPITMIFVAVGSGCNIGCAVVISRLFGAKEYGKMKTAVSTTVRTAVFLAVLLTGIGVLFNDRSCGSSAHRTTFFLRRRCICAFTFSVFRFCFSAILPPDFCAAKPFFRSCEYQNKILPERPLRAGFFLLNPRAVFVFHS